MKEVKICKAGSIGDAPVEPVIITVNEDLPDPTSGDVELAYDLDAGSLAQALFYSLPQGTFDRLIIKLMKRKISSYRGLTIS